MKKLFLICLVLMPAVDIFAKKKAKKNAVAQINQITINQQEYNQLFAQCQQFKAQFLKANSFENIRAKALQDFEYYTLPALKERLTSLGGGRSSAYEQILRQAKLELEASLNVQEAAHNAQLSNLLANNISLCLRGIGTPVALKLLSDLALSDFFLNINQG